MADAVESVCDLIGLGRSTVLQPDFPSAVLLNPEVPDSQALGMAHIVKGQWLTRVIPVKIVGAGFITQFFYHNMRRLGRGLKVDPDISIPKMLLVDTLESWRSGLGGLVQRLLANWSGGMRTKTD